MGQLRLQLGIAALPDISAVIAYRTGQIPIMRPAGFGAVIEHNLDRVLRILADNPRIGNVGEPVAVVPCDVVCGRHRICIGIMHPLVAHPRAELSHLRDIETVSGESGNVVFLHRSLRSRDVDPLDRIIVRATGKSILRSGLQLSFPDGIGKHRLDSVHPSRVVTGAVDGGVVGHFAGFLRGRF